MSIPNVVFDAALAKIATGTRVSICSAEPADFAGIAGVSLGNLVLTAGDGLGDWQIADGVPSGRQITLLEQQNLTPTANGTVNYLAIDDGATLLAATPVSAQAVTTTQIWSIPATIIWEVADPTYA